MRKKTKDIFENLEYLAIKKNNKQLLLLEDAEINGMSRTQLAKLIGLKLGEGVYHYAMKKQGEPKIIVGKISAIISKDIEPAKMQQPETNVFIEQLKKIESMLEGKQNSNNNFTEIIAMKDATYKIQIDFWKQQYEFLKAENEKLKKEINENGNSNNPLIEALAPLIVQSLTKQSTQ